MFRIEAREIDPVWYCHDALVRNVMVPLQLPANALRDCHDPSIASTPEHPPVASGHPEIGRIQEPAVIACASLFHQRSTVHGMHNTDIAYQRITMAQDHLWSADSPDPQGRCKCEQGDD